MRVSHRNARWRGFRFSSHKCRAIPHVAFQGGRPCHRRVSNRVSKLQSQFVPCACGFDSKLPSVFAKDAKSGLAAIKLFTKLPTEFSTRTSAFTAKSPENIFFNISEGKRTLRIVWGAGTDIELKLKVYTALLALPENKRITKIDLTEPYSPIVK